MWEVEQRRDYLIKMGFSAKKVYDAHAGWIYMMTSGFEAV